LGKNWTNRGTFNHGKGKVIFDGTNQTILGTTTFYDLTKNDLNNNDTDVVLTFEAGAQTTINGTVTWTGIDTLDRVNFVSSNPGTYWFLNMTSNDIDIDWVEVTDSNAGVGNPIFHTNTLNGGHTVNWFDVKIIWLSSTDGSFEQASKWDLGRVPKASDNVIINGGGANITWEATAVTNVNSLLLSSTYSGTLTLATSITAAASINVNAGTLRTAQGAISDITAVGTLSVGANGTIIVRNSSTAGNGVGQTITAAVMDIQGTVKQDNESETHSGLGDGPPGSTYSPIFLGSGGDIPPSSTGTITTHSGTNSTSDQRGFVKTKSGDSINLTTNLLTGRGTIPGKGGIGTNSSGGGGCNFVPGSDSHTGVLHWILLLLLILYSRHLTLAR